MDDRTINLTIRLTPLERELAQQAATHNGETLGSFFRRAAIPQARRIARRAEREQRENVSAASATA